LIGGLLATALVTEAVTAPTESPAAPKQVAGTKATTSPTEAATALARAIRTAELQSGYQLERLLRLLPA
jgi:hypothetical protein